MADDFDKLEARFDKIESWEQAEKAVQQERAAVEARNHVRVQLGVSVVSTLTMLVNLYLTLHHVR